MQIKYHWAALLSMCLIISTRECLAQAEIQTGSRAAIVLAPVRISDSVAMLARQQNRELSLHRIRDTLQTQFRTAINETGVFNLVERERLDAVLEEQAFQQTMTERPVEMGNMKGAAFTLFLEVDGFEDQEQSRTLGTGRSEKLRKIYLSAQVRVVDVVSGETLPDIPNSQIDREILIGQNELFAAGSPGGDRVFVEIATEAANELCQKVIAYLRPGRVLRVANNEVMINRGIPAGFAKGAIVEAYTVDEIIDPDTGAVFRDEFPAGKARITRADARSSYGQIIDGHIQPQSVAKVISRAPVEQPATSSPATVYSVPGL
jgi:curli biogenesis system outer membrane secretion channel CsgG